MQEHPFLFAQRDPGFTKIHLNVYLCSIRIVYVIVIVFQLVKSCFLVILTSNWVFSSFVHMKALNATSFTSRKTIVGPVLQLGRKNSRWEEKGGGSAANCPYNGFPGLHQAISFSLPPLFLGIPFINISWLFTTSSFMFTLAASIASTINLITSLFCLRCRYIDDNKQFFGGENKTYLMFNLSNADTELSENSAFGQL